MTPEDREEDVERQVEEVLGPVFDEHLDEVEADLQADLLEAGCALAEVLIAMQAAQAAGRLPPPTREQHRRLLDALERNQWQISRLLGH